MPSRSGQVPHRQHATTLHPIREREGRLSEQSDSTLIDDSSSEVTLAVGVNMSSPGTTETVERKKSFGIGGAGNIREPFQRLPSPHPLVDLLSLGAKSDIQAAIEKAEAELKNRTT
jgi:hypothetical protein